MTTDTLKDRIEGIIEEILMPILAVTIIVSLLYSSERQANIKEYQKSFISTSNKQYPIFKLTQDERSDKYLLFYNDNTQLKEITISKLYDKHKYDIYINPNNEQNYVISNNGILEIHLQSLNDIDIKTYQPRSKSNLSNDAATLLLMDKMGFKIW